MDATPKATTARGVTVRTPHVRVVAGGRTVDVPVAELDAPRR